MATDEAVKAGLVLKRGERGQVGVDRIGLLEAIRREGTINAAAKAQGLSYKGAGDAVQALNNLFNRPLVTTQAGGRSRRPGPDHARGRGPDRRLPLGRDRTRPRARHAFQTRPSNLAAAPGPGNPAPSLAMKTSARNALRGTVTRVTPGAVNSEVALDIGGGGDRPPR